MAQIEFAGIKFTGGKMAIVITLVTSLIGGLWGGFEVYKDYMDMKEKIQSYTAPDLSGLDKRIAVLENELTFVTDIKADVRRIESIVNDVEQRVKEDSRSNTKDLNETIKQIEDDMEKLENKVVKQIQIALENPLSNMK